MSNVRRRNVERGTALISLLKGHLKKKKEVVKLSIDEFVSICC